MSSQCDLHRIPGQSQDDPEADRYVWDPRVRRPGAAGARAYIAKLKAIAPPSDKRIGYQQYLAGGERGVALLAGASRAVRAGDARRAAASAEQLSAQVKLDNAKASSLGLKDCARG